MQFSWALDQMVEGERVRRIGWSEKYQTKGWKSMRLEKQFVIEYVFTRGDGEVYHFEKLAGAISIDDILAEDWVAANE